MLGCSKFCEFPFQFFNQKVRKVWFDWNETDSAMNRSIFNVEEDSGLLYVAEYALAIFISCALVTAWYRRRQQSNSIEIQEPDKHIWTIVHEYTFPTYCNVCEIHLVSGLSCDACGICIHESCSKEAEKNQLCKTALEESFHQKSLQHFWVKGNVPSDSVCSICGNECDNHDELCDFRCAWCQRVVHSECMDKHQRTYSLDWNCCDLGPFADFIISPATVNLKKVGWKGRKHLVVSEVVPGLQSPSWTPLVVIGTKKSGNNDGATILAAFRRILNPAQVVDVDLMPPEQGLEWCHLVPPGNVCRVLVCGGDGTIGWVLSTIDQLKLSPRPHVALLPLGTGNDLARVLKWGDGHTGSLNVNKVLNQVSQSEVVMLDRWKVKVVYNRRLGFRWPTKNLIMNNYTSIGVDALVTLNFHRQRANQPHIFRSRLLNKLVYFFYGTKDCLERVCQNLSSNLKLELDGRNVELPDLEGIVVLNIASWGAGCRVWEVGRTANTPTQSHNDGLLEIIGLYSSFHIAQLQVGLSEPVRLGQAREVRITVTGRTVPMQVDGEPWEQHSSTVTITAHTPQPMLNNTVSDDFW